jgi:MoxR-like ATPase
MVNAALYLRRPLLITGKPGAGKSTLAYAVARELRLGSVLRWNITSRTTLKDGLYHYDALGRLHDYNMNRSRPIGDYIDLGPLGTALLPAEQPRVLLIDEIDKADVDLPNDLLNVFEEGYFDIPELFREQEDEHLNDGANPVLVKSADGRKARVPPGRISCSTFPFVVLTSNGEREFPPPFLRRCLRLYLPTPDDKLLARIVDAHLPVDPQDSTGEAWRTERQRMIADFVQRAKHGDIATDQLLNALFLTVGANAAVRTADAGGHVDAGARRRLIDALLRHLTSDVAPTELLEKAALDVTSDGVAQTDGHEHRS